MSQRIEVTLRGKPRAWDFVLPGLGPYCEADERDLDWMLPAGLVTKGEMMGISSKMLIWPPWYGHSLRRLVRVDFWGICFGGKEFTVTEFSTAKDISEWDTALRSSLIPLPQTGVA